MKVLEDQDINNSSWEEGGALAKFLKYKWYFFGGSVFKNKWKVNPLFRIFLDSFHSPVVSLADVILVLQTEEGDGSKLLDVTLQLSCENIEMVR